MNDIPESFESFVGEEVKVNKSTFGANRRTYDVYEEDPNDVTVRTINGAAAKSGLEARFMLPNMVVTCEYQFNRLNFYVEQNESTGNFSIVRVGRG